MDWPLSWPISFHKHPLFIYLFIYRPSKPFLVILDVRPPSLRVLPLNTLMWWQSSQPHFGLSDCQCVPGELRWAFTQCYFDLSCQSDLIKSMFAISAYNLFYHINNPCWYADFFPMFPITLLLKQWNQIQTMINKYFISVYHRILASVIIWKVPCNFKPLKTGACLFHHQ